MAPPSEKGKGPLSVLLRENPSSARTTRDRCLSFRGATCQIVAPTRLPPRPKGPRRSSPRAEEREGRDLPLAWVEVDDVCGYDVDLDTPDQYAAEDALYLYEGPLPDDDESSD